MLTRRRPGQQKPNHVLAIVMDQHACHAMTEELIDTWWHALSPEEKAALYSASLDTEDEKPRARVTACNFFPNSDATIAAMSELKQQIEQALQLPPATQN